MHIWPTVKTGIIESCAMSLRISYFRKGAKNTAKEERLSPPERHRKTKKHQTLPEGATLTIKHTTRLFPVFTVGLSLVVREWAWHGCFPLNSFLSCTTSH